MFSSSPTLTPQETFNVNQYLIPCTAKCLYKQIEDLIKKLNQAYRKKNYQEHLEKELVQKLLLCEREILDPTEPKFSDYGFPGHWIQYQFNGENFIRGNFLDFIKTGPNSSKIISLDMDPLANKLLNLQAGDPFSIEIDGKEKSGKVNRVFDYEMSKIILKSKGFAGN